MPEPTPEQGRSDRERDMMEQAGKELPAAKAESPKAAEDKRAAADVQGLRDKMGQLEARLKLATGKNREELEQQLGQAESELRAAEKAAPKAERKTPAFSPEMSKEFDLTAKVADLKRSYIEADSAEEKKFFQKQIDEAEAELDRMAEPKKAETPRIILTESPKRLKADDEQVNALRDEIRDLNVQYARSTMKSERQALEQKIQDAEKKLSDRESSLVVGEMRGDIASKEKRWKESGSKPERDRLEKEITDEERKVRDAEAGYSTKLSPEKKQDLHGDLMRAKEDLRGAQSRLDAAVKTLKEKYKMSEDDITNTAVASTFQKIKTFFNFGKASALREYNKALDEHNAATQEVKDSELILNDPEMFKRLSEARYDNTMKLKAKRAGRSDRPTGGPLGRPPM